MLIYFHSSIFHANPMTSEHVARDLYHSSKYLVVVLLLSKHFMQTLVVKKKKSPVYECPLPESRIFCLFEAIINLPLCAHLEKNSLWQVSVPSFVFFFPHWCNSCCVLSSLAVLVSFVLPLSSSALLSKHEWSVSHLWNLSRSSPEGGARFEVLSRYICSSFFVMVLCYLRRIISVWADAFSSFPSSCLIDEITVQKMSCSDIFL